MKSENNEKHLACRTKEVGAVRHMYIGHDKWLFRRQKANHIIVTFHMVHMHILVHIHVFLPCTGCGLIEVLIT